MLVKAGAARREGAESATIYNAPISPAHFEATPDGGMKLTFIACGIHGRDRHTARYRYTVVLAAEELAIVTEGLKGSV